MRVLGGIYLIYGDDVSPQTGARVWRAAQQIEANPPVWITDWIPGYNRIFIEYDASRTNCARVLSWARRLLTDAKDVPERELVEVPVSYGGYDLPEVAAQTGLSEEEVVSLHSSPEYRVYAVGFTPGFPFMGLVPEQIRLPRRPKPRLRVPHLSVAMAGQQTGIYPQETPGGWHILGRALVRVYDPYRAEPFLLEPGDRVRFVPREGEVPAPPQPVELLREEGRPLLRIGNGGLLTLLVDGGRYRQGRYGLARSGPLDPYSHAVANALLGNRRDAPALEISLIAPELEALDDVMVALAGYGPSTSGAPEARSFMLRKGEVLKLKPGRQGARSYLAVAGGFDAAEFLGSVSPDLKGRIGRPLAAGDVLYGNTGKGLLPRSWEMPALTAEETTLRVCPGPQASEESLAALTGSVFTVGKADRMGLRLGGAVALGGEVTSEAIPIGAIQVPAGGEPLLLLADRGTVGGYAKPAIVHPRDLWKAGQLREGSRVRFELGCRERLFCSAEL